MFIKILLKITKSQYNVNPLTTREIGFPYISVHARLCVIKVLEELNSIKQTKWSRLYLINCYWNNEVYNSKHSSRKVGNNEMVSGCPFEALCTVNHEATIQIQVQMQQPIATHRSGFANTCNKTNLNCRLQCSHMFSMASSHKLQSLPLPGMASTILNQSC